MSKNLVLLDRDEVSDSWQSEDKRDTREAKDSSDQSSSSSDYYRRKKTEIDAFLNSFIYKKIRREANTR